MDNKICVVCNTEKSIDNFHNKYRECKPCNIKRSMTRYNDNKEKYQNSENYIMKKIEKCYLQSLKYINKTEYLIHNK